MNSPTTKAIPNSARRVFTSSPHDGDEPKYSRSVFEAILQGSGENSPSPANFDCRDAGVWIKDVNPSDPLMGWHPLDETVQSGESNIHEDPWLPFPFAARELAAMMANGYGSLIQQKYGTWEDGPDAEALRELAAHAGKAAEAVAAAYKAYRLAISYVPALDPSLERFAQELTNDYAAAREDAIDQEGHQRMELADAEHSEQLAHVNEDLCRLAAHRDEARRVANKALREWRKSVVQHLLLTIEKVPAVAFACPILRALP